MDCQKEARRARCASDVAPASGREGTGHLPVDPVEVLFRLSLHFCESPGFSAELMFQGLKVTVQGRGAGQDGHRPALDDDGTAEGREHALLATSP